ncbi:protein FAM3C-like [Gouania willdenowi]|uniref:protein FAM3C-like n=1 Tax=Gouania willdenowi TaxID=441366 RepID=UPI0010548199|nr:protein FAM3C-like [Gouania willdenowi]
MRYRTALQLAAAAVVILITWGISIGARQKIRCFLGFKTEDKPELTVTAPPSKCGLSKACRHDHFAIQIRSGGANVVGPNICFDGKIVMAHLLNNVGLGLNIVVVDGETAVIEKKGYLNMESGNTEDILAYLKSIKPGQIVLVASFDDVTKKMTPEMREIFVSMGSTLIRSVKPRDSWVFAGRAGTRIKSVFEKRAVNDEKTNVHDGWPEIVEVGGCFPRSTAD